MKIKNFENCILQIKQSFQQNLIIDITFQKEQE